MAGSTKVSNDVAQKAQQPESAGGKQAERDHAHGDKVHLGDHEHNNVVASAARAAEEYSQVAGAEQQGIQQADCRLQVDVHKADPGCKQLEQCISQPPSVKFSAYTVQVSNTVCCSPAKYYRCSADHVKGVCTRATCPTVRQPVCTQYPDDSSEYLESSDSGGSSACCGYAVRQRVTEL